VPGGKGLPDSNRQVRTTAIPIDEQFNGRITDHVWVAFITVGALVVLIACANVANLPLMRATARTRETAVHVSLGATPLRILRQLFVESALLAAAAAAVGLLLSIVGLRLLSTLTPPDTLPYWIQFTVDARVPAVLIGATAFCVIICGPALALFLRRLDVNEAPNEGGRSATPSEALPQTAEHVTATGANSRSGRPSGRPCLGQQTAPRQASLAVPLRVTAKCLFCPRSARARRLERPVGKVDSFVKILDARGV
jgi:hypothetical protein